MLKKPDRYLSTLNIRFKKQYFKYYFFLILFVIFAPNLNGKLPAKSARSFSQTKFLSAKIKILPNEQYFYQLINSIKKAKKSIYIGVYLFKITKNKSNPANILLEELIKSKKRGVYVNVLLERSNFNHQLNKSNRAVKKRLKKQRIKVNYDSPGKQSHQKLVVIDKRLTFIGSHNFSHSALKFNNELSVMIQSTKVAKDAIKFLKSSVK